jgi:hypothetical protein
MFVTYEEYKAPFPSFFGKELTYWKATELALHRLWFLVSISQPDPDDSDSFPASRTLLISNIADVEQFAKPQAASQLQLDAVFIVTPGHVNGSRQWKMEALRSVWRAEEPSAPGQLAEIYETAEGQTYVDSMLGTLARHLQKKVLHHTFPLQQ